MKKAVLALSILCAAANNAQAFEVFDRPPKWIIGCDNKKKDAFGVSKRAYCWLSVSNNPSATELMDDNSFVISNETIIEVDVKGIKIITPRHKKLCVAKGSPKRIAVDGKRIDGISTLKQLQKMLTGKRLAWEKQADWPNCGIAGYGTYLDGFREALDDLHVKWDATSQ